MRGFWGLMRAYWISDRWKEAWGLTIVIALLTALSSKASVWLAEASGELVNSIALFHDPENATPLASLLTSAALLVLLVLIKDAGFTGIRHLFSSTLHRKWRGWLDGRFNDALLDGNHTHFHLQHGASVQVNGSAAAPDNVDQRVQESIKGMTGGAIGLAMGIVGVFTSLFFVGQKLLEISTKVSGLEFLGDYGSAVLAFAAVATYVPLNTLIALKLGRLLERLTVRMQQAEGSYRGELTTLFRRSFHVAASRGEGVQKAMHDRLYLRHRPQLGEPQQDQCRLHVVRADLQFRGGPHRRLRPEPHSLHAERHQPEELRDRRRAGQLADQPMLVVHPRDARDRDAESQCKAGDRSCRGDRERAAAARVLPPQTGHSDFHYGTQNAVFGLRIQNLELMHQGSDAVPFLSAANLRFRRGEWTFVTGDSGCGKTSLIKAINGLWPYGRGNVDFPDGVKTFYAAQDVKLPNVSLKELVCLPRRAARLFGRAGRGGASQIRPRRFHRAPGRRRPRGKGLGPGSFRRPEAEAGRRPHPAAAARAAVPRRGDRRARPASQDRLPPGDQGSLPAHHGDQHHA